MRICITGGARFIASHLMERLLSDPEVGVYDNRHRNAMQYTHFTDHPRFRFIEGDVLEADRLCSAMEGADLCVRAAAIAGIYSVGLVATSTLKVNFLGTYHALESAVKNKVKRLLISPPVRFIGPFILVYRSPSYKTCISIHRLLFCNSHR